MLLFCLTHLVKLTMWGHVATGFTKRGQLMKRSYHHSMTSDVPLGTFNNGLLLHLRRLWRSANKQMLLLLLLLLRLWFMFWPFYSQKVEPESFQLVKSSLGYLIRRSICFLLFSPLSLSWVLPEVSIGFLCFGLAPGPAEAVKRTAG